MSARRAALALVLAALVSAGCWSRREPEQLARIDVAALDLLPSGQVRWRVELPIAPETGAGAVRQGGGGRGRVRVLAEGTGGDVNEAEQQLARTLGRELFWAHTDFFLVGEDAARAGLTPLLDFIARRYRVRRNSLLFVTRGRAGDLLARSDPALDPLTAQFLRNLTRGTRPTAVATVDANAFLRRLEEPGLDPFLPALQGRPREGGVSPAPAGLGAFRGDRLVAFMPEDAALGVWWLRGEAPIVDLVVPCPGSRAGDDVLAVRVLHSTARVQAHRGAGGVAASARVAASGELLAWTCGFPLHGGGVEVAERAVAERMLAQMRAALALMREHGTDPVGFGARLHRSDPAAWAEVAADWRRLLRSLPVELEASFLLRDTGLSVGPP